jgi:hypothetical protein
MIVKMNPGTGWADENERQIASGICRTPVRQIMTAKAKWAALGCGDPRRISETKMGSAFN